MSNEAPYWLYEKVIAEARECQRLMGDRTARFVRQPSDKEVLDEQKGHVVTMIVRKEK